MAFSLETGKPDVTIILPDDSLHGTCLLHLLLHSSDSKQLSPRGFLPPPPPVPPQDQQFAHPDGERWYVEVGGGGSLVHMCVGRVLGRTPISVIYITRIQPQNLTEHVGKWPSTVTGRKGLPLQYSRKKSSFP